MSITTTALSDAGVPVRRTSVRRAARRPARSTARTTSSARSTWRGTSSRRSPGTIASSCGNIASSSSSSPGWPAPPRWVLPPTTTRAPSASAHSRRRRATRSGSLAVASASYFRFPVTAIRSFATPIGAQPRGVVVALRAVLVDLRELRQDSVRASGSAGTTAPRRARSRPRSGSRGGAPRRGRSATIRARSGPARTAARARRRVARRSARRAGTGRRSASGGAAARARGRPSSSR